MVAMHNYKDFLIEQGYSQSSLLQKMRFVNYFLGWLETNNIKPNNFQYDQIVDFIDTALKFYSNRNNAVATINRLLSAISTYYDFINMNENNILNLPKIMRVKNPGGRKVKNLINRRELIDIYYNIPKFTDRDIRNRVIFGLVVFQALTTGEVARLTVRDFDFENGTVLIQNEICNKLKKGNNSRIIHMEAKQILDLLDYKDNIRPRILANYYRNLPGRKPGLSKTALTTTDQMILSMFGSVEIKNSVLHLFRNIRKTNPSIRNARQVRQSIIAYWVTRHNLRTVQYMAGHRYVGSTEYYKQVNINDLRKDIMEFHPLN